MMDKLVSIIIPVYNASATLQRCVESIINNDYKNIEIILVNDCSKDNSLDFCKLLTKTYLNVRYETNDVNKGVSYTRNKGISLASGDYIIFIDSDDYVEHNFISSLINIKNKNNDSFVLCGYLNEDMKYSKRIDDIIYSSNETDNLGLDCLEELHNKTLLQQLWNKVFIKDVIINNNILFDESINVGEDFKFILEYLKCSQYKDIYVINKSLYHYMRDQETSLMYNVNYTHLDVSLQNMKMMYNLLGKSNQEIKDIISNKKLSMLNNYAYLIFRNKNMSFKNKKYNIYNLDSKLGKKLFRDNVILYIKEIIRKFI